MHDAPQMTAITIERRNDPEGTSRILRALPDWFGIEEATLGYVDAAKTKPSWVAVDGQGRTMGVALVERHFPTAAELYLIAVDPAVRHEGIGRRLVDALERDLTSEGVEFLQVKTVGPSFEDRGYAETRAFYKALGFVPVEEFAKLDWDGPTLLSIKSLREHPAT